jgi:hypothetical protein
LVQGRRGCVYEYDLRPIITCDEVHAFPKTAPR